MGKRHPNLPAWQWRSNPQRNQGVTYQALNVIALPMIVLAFLLLASGVFSANGTSAIMGLLTLLAGMSLQHQGRRLDAKAEINQRSQTF